MSAEFSSYTMNEIITKLYLVLLKPCQRLIHIYWGCHQFSSMKLPEKWFMHWTLSFSVWSIIESAQSSAMSMYVALSLNQKGYIMNSNRFTLNEDASIIAYIFMLRLGSESPFSRAHILKIRSVRVNSLYPALNLLYIQYIVVTNQDINFNYIP